MILVRFLEKIFGKVSRRLLERESLERESGVIVILVPFKSYFSMESR